MRLPRHKLIRHWVTFHGNFDAPSTKNGRLALKQETNLEDCRITRIPGDNSMNIPVITTPLVKFPNANIASPSAIFYDYGCSSKNVGPLSFYVHIISFLVACQVCVHGFHSPFLCLTYTYCTSPTNTTHPSTTNHITMAVKLSSRTPSMVPEHWLSAYSCISKPAACSWNRLGGERSAHAKVLAAWDKKCMEHEHTHTQTLQQTLP